MLNWLLALVFLAAGIPKLLGVAQIAARFEHFGYPPWFRLAIGVVEISGGVSLLVPSIAPYGTALLIVDMFGATLTVLRVGDSPLPPLVVGALLSVLAVLSWRKGARTRISTLLLLVSMLGCANTEYRFERIDGERPVAMPFKFDGISGILTARR